MNKQLGWSPITLAFILLLIFRSRCTVQVSFDFLFLFLFTDVIYFFMLLNFMKRKQHLMIDLTC